MSALSLSTEPAVLSSDVASQGEAVGAGNFTAAVADCIEIFQQQLARSGNQTAVVVQHAFA
ncbi:hypothetical protein PSYJA_33680 [Pseudomonas syringae pv. japonica str. M301072]|uniref:Uncharacterized protein n=1 Tax=Pseudomonas syringae pv. japonica str. M301072 TaxID=629262 RepID=F3FTQ9_PSESX|nr:hypothetical protein PSYJA_33680 [Pseudomonas syringae pv. japonica str. M301072]